jgi:geranylgeranylglycerol-phosphate geranylgeranyltransferase
MLAPPASPLRSFAALVRVGTCTTGAILCLLGAALAGNAAGAALATVSIACAIAFAQVVNDISDVDLDRLDKPHRPLPTGAISLAAARATAITTAAACLLAAAASRPATFAFAVVLIALSWLYSTHLKSTVLAGNVVVAALASSTVTFGAVAAGAVPPRVLALQAMLATFSLAFEVLKTAVDASGDAAGDVRTVATRFGARAAARLSAVLCLAFVATVPWPALHDARPLPYLLAITAGAAVPAAIAAIRIFTDTELAGPLWLLRKVWITGVLALLLLL